MSHIYLTGDVVESTDLSGLVDRPEPDWRTIALSKLQRYGVRVWDKNHWPAVRRLLNDSEWRHLRCQHFII